MPINPTDHEALRRYLLGDQPEPEADNLERRLLEEADLSELALAVKEELIEDCVRGDLDPEHRGPLLARLAASPTGREQIAFQRALVQVAGEQAKPLPPPVSFPTRWWQAAAHRPRIAASLAACLVACAIVGPSVWTGVQSIFRPQPGVVENAPGMPLGMAKVVYTLGVARTRKGTPDKQVEKVVIHDPSQRIELRIDLGKKQPYSDFRAILKVKDEDVWREDWQTAGLSRADEGRTVVLPLLVLREGKYEVEIEGIPPAGKPRLVGNTKFEVVVQ